MSKSEKSSQLVHEQMATVWESEQYIGRKMESGLCPERDMGELELADLIDTQAIQSLMDDFYVLAHIPMSIIDLKGRVLVGVGWQQICTGFHRVCPQSCANCLESDTQLSKNILPGEFKLYKCKNNMWDIATPIVVGGQHVGNLFSGQFFFDHEPLDYDLFRAQARHYGFNEEAYLTALEQVPRLSQETVDRGIAFLMKLAHMISLLSYSNIKLARSLTERNILMDSLRQSEERYRSLFQNNHSVMLLIDPKSGDIIDANPAACSFYGYIHSEITGLKISDINQLTREQVYAEMERARCEQRNHFFFCHRLASGEVREVEVYSGPLEFQGNRLLYSIVHDITERKQMEAELRASEVKYQNALDAMLEGCQIIGFDWRYLYLNDVADLHNRRPKEALIGHKYTDMWPGIESTEVFMVIRRCMEERQPQFMENEFAFPDGSKGWFELKIYPVPEGIVILSIDITEHKRAEALLWESEQLYRTVGETIPYGVWLTDATGYCTYVSSSFLDLVDMTMEQVQQFGWLHLLPPEDVQPTMDHWLQCVQTGANFEREHRFRTAEGSYCYVLAIGRPVRDAQGQITCWVGLNLDITKRKRAENELIISENNLATSQEIAHIGSYTWDLEKNQLIWSDELYRILGLVPQQIRPAYDTYTSFIHPDDREEAIRKIRKVVEEGQTQPNEHRIVRSDGTVRVVQVQSKVWRENKDKPGKVYGIVQDITERKEAETVIRKLNEELEQRVIERTAQLEATNKELEAFAYSISHDLRTPLRSIDGFSQALLEDYADHLDVEGQKHLQRVRAASQRMGQLIDDLLALSRLTRSEIHTEEVNLSELAQAIAEELGQAEPNRQVEFIVVGGVVAQADARLIRVALENLFGNAWKFTAKRPSARIEFGTILHDGQPAYFVRDDGAGFDMAYAGKLFGAFQRLHTPAEFPGTGIGLATVQRIIHRHGGRVWAEGAVGQGATFYFTL